MWIEKTMLVALFLACFLSFGWAMQGGFFRTVDARTPLGLRLIRIFGTSFSLLHLFALVYGRPLGGSPVATTLAVLLYLASFFLFWSAIRANRARPLSLGFNSDTPEHLVATGPYRWIRHPFYTAYSLGWIAGVVGSGQWWLVLTVLTMCTIYYRAARMEERKFAASPLAAQYAAYQQRVGMFLPWRPSEARSYSSGTSA